MCVDLTHQLLSSKTQCCGFNFHPGYIFMYMYNQFFHRKSLTALGTLLPCLLCHVMNINYIGYTTPTRRFSVSLNRRVGVVLPVCTTECAGKLVLAREGRAL